MLNSGFSAKRLGLLLVGLAAMGGSFARGETLRWKFKQGESLHWTMDKQDVFSEVKDERESKTTVSQATEMSWTVKSVAEDGSAELTLKIDRVVAKNRTPYGNFEFDSNAKKAAANPTEAAMQELMKAVVGAPFSCKISPSGALSDVRVPEAVTKLLADEKKDAPEGESAMSDESFKKMFTSMSMPLPKEEVAPGKTWTQQAKFATPPAGSMTIDTTFRFVGPDAQAGPNIVRIDLESKYTPDLPPKNDVKVTIKTQEGKGSILFDTAAGRITKLSSSEKDERHISVMGMEIDLSKVSTTNLTLVPEAGAAK